MGKTAEKRQGNRRAYREEDKLRCPSCRRTIAKLRYGAEATGVDVICPRCGSVVELSVWCELPRFAHGVNAERAFPVGVLISLPEGTQPSEYPGEWRKTSAIWSRVN